MSSVSGSPSVYSGVSKDNNDDMYEDYHDNVEAEHRETVETELMRTPDFVSVPQVFWLGNNNIQMMFLNTKIPVLKHVIVQ